MSEARLLVRSLVFNILFYVNMVLLMIVGLPTLLLPRWGAMGLIRLWARSSLWLLRVICDIKVDVRGAEKLPHGAAIIASKHQSAWDTFALVPLLADPTFIVKRELMWIPFFGWYAQKAEMIPVDRSAGGAMLSRVAKRARDEVAKGRQIVIFPEGTRRAVGAEPAYKPGVAHLYAETGAPCVPIALNSGLFWARRSFWRFPGTVRVEVLDAIPPGLGKQVFRARLQDAIERATADLVAQGRWEQGL
jgi:1-acyl-sn-glycerol-3-phosphate acyltransferase